MGLTGSKCEAGAHSKNWSRTKMKFVEATLVDRLIDAVAGALPTWWAVVRQVNRPNWPNFINLHKRRVSYPATIDDGGGHSTRPL